MKATKLVLATAFCAGLATLSFAGPGPDYWARTKMIEKKHAEAKAQAAVKAKAQATTQVAVCANCCCPAMKKA